jgi:hypothetical protein
MQICNLHHTVGRLSPFAASRDPRGLTKSRRYSTSPRMMRHPRRTRLQPPLHPRRLSVQATELGDAVQALAHLPAPIRTTRQPRLRTNMLAHGKFDQTAATQRHSDHSTIQHSRWAYRQGPPPPIGLWRSRRSLLLNRCDRRPDRTVSPGRAMAATPVHTSKRTRH